MPNPDANDDALLMGGGHDHHISLFNDNPEV